MLLLTTADKKLVVVKKKIQKRKWLQTDREREIECTMHDLTSVKD